jgi:hypothetical protein
MPAKGEPVTGAVLSGMIGVAIAGETYHRLPADLQGEVSGVKVGVIGGKVLEIALEQARQYSADDPRLAVMQAFATQLTAAVARPEGAK